MNGPTRTVARPRVLTVNGPVFRETDTPDFDRFAQELRPIRRLRLTVNPIPDVLHLLGGVVKLRLPVHKVRSVTSMVAELAGFGCLVAAAFWWLPIVGLVALGVALWIVAQGIE